MTTTTRNFILYLALALVFVNSGMAQRGKVAKATKEYNKYAYIDAQQVYLDVVEKGYESAEVYQKLGNTYYFNSQYSEAVKWYKELVNKFPNEATTTDLYRLAQCYKSVSQYDNSNKVMDMYIAKGGDTTKIAENYAGGNYLEQIAVNALNYELKAVSTNSGSSDFGPSYFGDQIVFASASDTIIDSKLAIHEWNNQPFLDLYVADVDEEGDLSNLRALEGAVNSKYHESSPTFSKDGKTMYFTRNNYLDGKKGKDVGMDDERSILLKVYKATLGDDGWSNIEELPFNSDDYNVAHPVLSLDQKRLYFVSDMEGSVGMSDIWYVYISDDGSYGDPVNVAGVNTEARESFPFISSDNMLYFSSDGRAGLGGLDVYVTELDDSGMPTDVKNLGAPTNSEKDDFAFIFNPEKKMGYVSSNRSGDGGFVNDDIYLVVPCLVTLNGVVTDLDTGELLPGARVQLFDANNDPVGDPVVVGDDASYTFNIECGKNYRLQADKLDYITNEILFEAPSTSGEFYQPIALKPVDCASNDLGCQLTLQPIYFDLDRYNIRPDAEVELAKILSAMQKYPELVIHIESHTDSRATDQYNIVLSDRRAQSTMNWLIERGIDASRLSAKGYGETQLVNNCSNDVDCTEEEHQLNRRSMFIIQN